MEYVVGQRTEPSGYMNIYYKAPEKFPKRHCHFA